MFCFGMATVSIVQCLSRWARKQEVRGSIPVQDRIFSARKKYPLKQLNVNVELQIFDDCNDTCAQPARQA
jgi:hypothetical protein